MLVKDLMPVLNKKREFFEDLQKIELSLRDADLCKELNTRIGIDNIQQTIIEARMSFYDNEVRKLEKLIENAVVQDEK